MKDEKIASLIASFMPGNMDRRKFYISMIFLYFKDGNVKMENHTKFDYQSLTTLIMQSGSIMCMNTSYKSLK